MTTVRKASFGSQQRNGHSPAKAGGSGLSRLMRIDAFRFLMLILAAYSVLVTVVLTESGGAADAAGKAAKEEADARFGIVEKEKSKLKGTILSLQKRMQGMVSKSKAAKKGDDEREKVVGLKETITSLQRRIEEMTAREQEQQQAAAAAADAAPPVVAPPKKTRHLRDETPPTRHPAAAKSTKVWTKTEHTLSDFAVGGINLARYEMGSAGGEDGAERGKAFELYDDFDISDRITGNESWNDLVNYRRHLRRLSLPFYVDKVAVKRWLPTIGVPIPRPYQLTYRSEIAVNDALEEPWQSVNELIPREMSFAAKPCHLSHADGVYLLSYKDDAVFVSKKNENMKKADHDTKKVVKKAAKYLEKHLQEKADGEQTSWALEQVAPGLVIEERFTSWDQHDSRPAVQFQVLVIWGKVYLALWGRGQSRWGLVSRDGKVDVNWSGRSDRHTELPEWVDWSRVVELAEGLGAHKDMLRVDIFVGVPADSPVLEDGASEVDRRSAVRTVVSGFELAPSLELEEDPTVMEEGARLWIAGYKMGNYGTVPNTEIPSEYVERGELSPPAETKNWIKTVHTFSKFDVLGVNLATYRMPPSSEKEGEEAKGENAEPFELYGNFDIADMITGNENWWTLVEYRRELAKPGLNFYVDKVAQKRWLPSIGMPIPRPFLTRYASEVPEHNAKSGVPEEKTTLYTMLPQESNYAAKPSHTSCSDGVWLVKYEDGVTKVGAGSFVMKKANEGKIEKIAASLAKNLKEKPRDLESWALKNVEPGLVVEERFTAWDSDDKSAMEFKIFCFWGRVWLANWRRGSARWGLVHRDGRVVDWDGKQKDHEVIPDWVHWPRVIEIAEKMAAKKDMFRVDIFVGVPASSPSLKEDATDEEKRAAVEIVISEFEVHPTTKFNDPRLFEEAARLWIAGYKKLKIKAVANDEVPRSYVETGMLPQPPESREYVKTKHTTTHFDVAGVDLGPYRMTEEANRKKDKKAIKKAEPFELYDDFDIGDKITGNEPWWELIAYRIGLEDRPGLPFYNDKVALRRWLPSVGVPMPKSFVLKYGSELTETGEKKKERKAIVKLLPKDEDFVAKPSHSCFGDDVWIVKHELDPESKARTVSVNGGIGAKRLTEVEEFDASPIGKALTASLHLEPGNYGSWVYDHIKPGVVVEERFASLDDDNKPAMEFKVFTIWGHAYVAQWRRGAYNGLVYPDGKVVDWGGKKKKYSELPDWVDWPEVVKLAERMGAHKDMFRTDIFVGIPAGSKALREGSTEKERRAAVRVVVSEFEMQPGTTQMDPGIFDDAARLWIAGYKIGNYRVVKNTEVPSKFLEVGSLAEDDAPGKDVQ